MIGATSPQSSVQDFLTVALMNSGNTFDGNRAGDNLQMRMCACTTRVALNAYQQVVPSIEVHVSATK